MANHNHIVPFILKWEGGYVDNPADKGGKTNKGVTYETWKKFFGDTPIRFMTMNPEDWSFIFYNGYWSQILGDKIKSQRIADVIVDWVYNSGKRYPEKDIQEILNHAFGQHLAEDGNFGDATINSINSVDEPTEYQAILARHLQFLDNLVEQNASQNVFLQGWKNRAADLQKFELNNPV